MTEAEKADLTVKMLENFVTAVGSYATIPVCHALAIHQGLIYLDGVIQHLKQNKPSSLVTPNQNDLAVVSASTKPA